MKTPKIVFADGGELDSDSYEWEETSADAAFSCYFLCQYSDCEFEIAKIKCGSRVLLKYSLHCKVESKPTANSLNKSMVSGGYTVTRYFLSNNQIKLMISINQSMLKSKLGDLPPAERLLLIPTAKDCTAFSLANKGVNSLTHSHRAYFQAIKTAIGTGR
jgi:hypothetical protein